MAGHGVFAFGLLPCAVLEEAALKEREAILTQSPMSQGVARDVALARLALGDFALIAAKDPAKAWDEYTKVAEAFTKLVQATQGKFSARRDLSAAQYRLGVIASRLPDPPGGAAVASRYLDECLKTRLDLAKIDTKDTQAQFACFTAWHGMARNPIKSVRSVD